MKSGITHGVADCDVVVVVVVVANVLAGAHFNPFHPSHVFSFRIKT